MVYASNETDWLFTKTVDEVGVAVIAALALTIKVEVNKTKTNKALNIFLIDAPCKQSSKVHTFSPANAHFFKASF